MRKKISVLVILLVVVGLFFGIPAAASIYDRGPSRPVAARMSGIHGQPTEEFLVKGYVYQQQAEQIFEMLNLERQARGLSALEWDEDHYVAAQQRAFEISQHFAHERPDGRPVDSITSRYAGENLGSCSVGDNGAKLIMEAWMQSQGHRDNILRSEYQTVAIACVEVNDTFYWVQLFSHESANQPMLLQEIL